MELPVLDENLLTVSFTPQVYIDDENVVHVGERLTMKEGVTGYVDWNTGLFAKPNVNSARMKIGDEDLDIWVEENMQEEGVGGFLFANLINRVQQRGYERLVVLGAGTPVKNFYDKSLQELKREGSIRNFQSTPREIEQGIKDYLYEILF